MGMITGTYSCSSLDYLLIVGRLEKTKVKKWENINSLIENIDCQSETLGWYSSFVCS